MAHRLLVILTIVTLPALAACSDANLRSNDLPAESYFESVGLVLVASTYELTNMYIDRGARDGIIAGDPLVRHGSREEIAARFTKFIGSFDRLLSDQLESLNGLTPPPGLEKAHNDYLEVHGHFIWWELHQVQVARNQIAEATPEQLGQEGLWIQITNLMLAGRYAAQTNVNACEQILGFATDNDIRTQLVCMGGVLRIEFLNP